MDFPAISKLRVKNFRNIGDVTISFEESPIVTLMGENEAGKTSIVKALAVAGVNAYPTRQAKFIRTGTSGFGIQVSFDDGSYLMRQKGGPGIGNTLKVKLADGTELRDDKIDRGEGVPVNMEKMMGFMVEPETGELLNVRTYEDALMFVTTSDSANYKVLYNALKVGQVTRAIKAGNKEVAALRGDIDANSVRMDGIQHTLRSIRIVDLTPLTGIKQRLEAEVEKLRQLAEATQTLETIQEAQRNLGALAEIEQKQLQPIDMRTIEWLNQAISAGEQLANDSKRLEGIGAVMGISEVDIRTAEKLSSAVELLSTYNQQRAEADRYLGLAKASTVNTVDLSRVAEAKAEYDRYVRACSEAHKFSELASVEILDTAPIALFVHVMESKEALESKTRELELLNQSIRECVHTIEQAGGNVGVCSNCGHMVVVQKISENGGCGCVDENSGQ